MKNGRIKKIIIIGGEGNGTIVSACIVDMEKRYGVKECRVYGFLNDYFRKNTKIDGFPVLGPTKDASKYLKDKNVYFVFAVHPIGHGTVREELFNRLNIPSNRLATIIHPTAFVASNAVIEPGVFIMSNCYIGTKSRIKKCTMILANAAISHHTSVGPLCHISPNATIGSYSRIGIASDVAYNTVILNHKTIGNHAVAGAGSVITRDINDEEVVVGNPGRVLRMASNKLKYTSLDISKK